MKESVLEAVKRCVRSSITYDGKPAGGTTGQIADEVKLTTPKARRCLLALEAKGLVTKTQRRRNGAYRWLPA